MAAVYGAAELAIMGLGACAAVWLGLGLLWVRKRQDRRATELVRERAERSRAGRDQSWYWTDEWQAGEAGVEADLAQRRSRTYDGLDELLDALNALGVRER